MFVTLFTFTGEIRNLKLYLLCLLLKRWKEAKNFTPCHPYYHIFFPTLMIPFQAAITSFPIKNEINEGNKTEKNSPSCRFSNHEAPKVVNSTKKCLLVFLIHVLIFH